MTRIESQCSLEVRTCDLRVLLLALVDLRHVDQAFDCFGSFEARELALIDVQQRVDAPTRVIQAAEEFQNGASVGRERPGPFQDLDRSIAVAEQGPANLRDAAE